MLGFIPYFDLITRDDTIVERDASLLEKQRDFQKLKLTFLKVAQFAEIAVEQHAKSIRQGEVSVFRRKARSYIEGARENMGVAKGKRDVLNRLLETKVISGKQFRKELQVIEKDEGEVLRLTLISVTEFLNEIRNYVRRDKRRGRPRLDSGHSRQQFKDGSLFHEAVMAAGGYTSMDRDTVAASTPGVVKSALADGRLPALGETRQEAVDRHSKRIRNLLDNLPDLR